MYKWRQIMIKKPLGALGEGETGEIVQIRGKPAMQRYLYEMGLIVGRDITIKKIEKSPEDHSVVVEASGKTVTLGKKAALDIMVQVPLVIDEREIPGLSRAYARLYTTNVIKR